MILLFHHKTACLYSYITVYSTLLKVYFYLLFEMSEFQGKLFVTVIQAQNLNIKKEESSSAAGQFVGALSNNMLQGIEKIQSFSSTHVKKLESIFTVPGQFVQGIGSLLTGQDQSAAAAAAAAASPIVETGPKDIPQVGAICAVTVPAAKDDTPQVFKTVRASSLVEPVWNESYSFNVFDPCSRIDFQVKLDSNDGDDFLIGKASIQLDDELHLFGQKPAAKWIYIRKRVKNGEIADDDDVDNYREDEVVGRIEVQMQYKFRKVWECVYHGKMLYIEKNYTDALEQLAEAIEKVPANPKIYSVIVDCYLGLKNNLKAIENCANIIKYDHNGTKGNLTIAKVLMAAGQLEKAQAFIDKAKRSSPKSERVQNAQLELSHLVEVDKINKLMDNAFGEFSRNEFPQAIETFNKCIEINSHSPVLYELRALCHMASKNNAAAIEDSNKILEIDHNWPRKETVLSGFMNKDGQINVMAKKRWFVLKSHFLFYFKDQNDLQPQGVVCLTDFGCAPKPGQKSKFQVKTRDREYYLKVDTPEDFDKWVNQLTKMSRTKLKLPLLKTCQDQIVWRNIYLVKDELEGKTGQYNVADVLMLPETLFVESGRFAFSIGDKIKAKFHSIVQAECSRVGWLYKIGQVNKEWQKRYFMIHKDTLYYVNIKDGDEKALSITPTGILPLTGAKVDLHPEGVAKAHSFSINTALRRNFIIAADDQESKDKWVRAVHVAAGTVQDNTNDKKDGSGSGSSTTTTTSGTGTGTGKTTDENQEDAPVPSSETIFANRSRRIKSLRAVPSDIEIQLKKEQEESRFTSPKEQKKIGFNEMSASESKYFSKFNLPIDHQNAAPVIISSKQNIDQSNSNLNSSTSGTNNNNQNSSSNNNINSSYSPQLTSSTQITSVNTGSSSPHNLNSMVEDETTIEEDDVGLVSGKKKKNINDSNEIDDDDKKRCFRLIYLLATIWYLDQLFSVPVPVWLSHHSPYDRVTFNTGQIITLNQTTKKAEDIVGTLSPSKSFPLIRMEHGHHYLMQLDSESIKNGVQLFNTHHPDVLPCSYHDILCQPGVKGRIERAVLKNLPFLLIPMYAELYNVIVYSLKQKTKCE
ncbi:hypothetical protein DFA_10511 [Cavenderia fasciculata]|uniref:Pleckstrin domain-containing protein n=1 Tax=Cavenderia fasciculata TaxID=261658 RepID=F4QAF0_CACFS|nr:uncharacterized protein DFA_10511 [Cavenderia fasciculata]EGG15669.1 hypothetical protein DFA_10511 [Cavenderia fasciculata]|eukprot:XP_004354411.1 hypothetical protein DFA_10511 [Cavenderia fasciculata]